MAGDIIQEFTVSKAFRMRLQPLVLQDGISIDKPGLYLAEEMEPFDILRYYLNHDARKLIYLPWDKGEKEVSKYLMGLGEKLPSSDEVKQIFLTWKDKESRLILFHRAWITVPELNRYISENPEAGLVIIEGIRVLCEPGETGDIGDILNELRRLAKIRRICIITFREFGLEPFIHIFEKIINPHGNNGK